MAISAVIHTYNAEHTLSRALKSVEWVDEIVVVDMESTDSTVAMAEKAGAKVLIVKHQQYADPARNFGLQQARGNWIIVLDADEELPAQLKDTFHSLLAGESDVAAYYVPRQNVIFGHSMQHTGWWPDYQLRFFRKGVVTWPKEVHGQPKVDGNVAYLPAEPDLAIIHYNYPSVTSYIERLDRYTDIKAAELHESPKKRRPFVAFGTEFLRRYFALDGWQDASHGANLSLLQAMYEVVVDLKVWEKKGFKESAAPTQHVTDLADFSRQLQYWLADWHVNHSTGLVRLWWQLRRKLLS